MVGPEDVVLEVVVVLLAVVVVVDVEKIVVM